MNKVTVTPEHSYRSVTVCDPTRKGEYHTLISVDWDGFVHACLLRRSDVEKLALALLERLGKVA